MRWMKRALWVAAWVVWLWCGVKLSRELPRRHDNMILNDGTFTFSGQVELFQGDGERDLVYINDSLKIAVNVIGFRVVGSDRSGALEFFRGQAGATSTGVVKTFAVMGPHGLVFRLWGAPADPRKTILDNSPPPNWPLLAFCQTILALPLILLWAMFRWRRKRRMRLASAAM